MHSDKVVNILGMSGSLRSDSFSTGILRTLAAKVAPSMNLRTITLEDIPFYNEDLDVEPGVPAVTALRNAVASCDGVLIATPEYNHGIPGVLKNTLDWLSRPVFHSCFRDKPVSIISSSKAFTGGVRAQYQLRETLISMHAHLVMGPEVVVGGVHQHFAGSTYTNEAGLSFMLQSIGRLSAEVAKRTL